MTGIHARLGWSIRSVRTSIEVSVLLIGCVLGGTFGVGTVLYALTIGSAYPALSALVPPEATHCGNTPAGAGCLILRSAHMF